MVRYVKVKVKNSSRSGRGTIVNVKNDCHIIVGEYPFADKLKADVLPILEKEPDAQKRETNVKATMTDWHWGDNIPLVVNLQRYLLNEIPTPTVCGDGKFIRVSMSDFWGNVYHKNDYTQTHNHQPYYYSLVYFLKCKWYDSPLVFSDYGQKIRPKEGRYVIFPSSIFHHVPKHRYRDTRVTLSGNTKISENIPIIRNGMVKYY